jgi:hypothetical protein
MTSFRARLRDPVMVLLIIGVVLVVAGFFSLLLGWRGAARTLNIPVQIPFLVSGGLGGIALIGMGLGLCNLTASRREAAREITRLQGLVDEAAKLLSAVELRRLRERANASKPKPATTRARRSPKEGTRSPSTKTPR